MDVNSGIESCLIVLQDTILEYDNFLNNPGSIHDLERIRTFSKGIVLVLEKIGVLTKDEGQEIRDWVCRDFGGSCPVIKRLEELAAEYQEKSQWFDVML